MDTEIDAITFTDIDEDFIDTGSLPFDLYKGSTSVLDDNRICDDFIRGIDSTEIKDALYRRAKLVASKLKPDTHLEDLFHIFVTKRIGKNQNYREKSIETKDIREGFIQWILARGHDHGEEVIKRVKADKGACLRKLIQEKYSPSLFPKTHHFANGVFKIYGHGITSLSLPDDWKDRRMEQFGPLNL